MRSNHPITGLQYVQITLLQVDTGCSCHHLFANVNIDNFNSPEFGAHVLRVFFGLNLCVNALQDLPVLEELISHLARQHVARVGVKAAYFDVSWLICVIV